MSYKIKGKEYTDQEAYDKFIEDFCGLIETYKNYEVSDDAEIPRYYGNIMAQSDRDPMGDADIIESDLYDEGWTDDNLKKLFTQFRDELMEELNDKSIGGFDVFLYNWTNGEFFLGGAPLVDDSDDILVKYCYGWNKTKYGQLILKQNNMLDNFLELSTIAIKKEIVETAIEYLMSPGNIADHYINQESRKQVIKKCNKFIKVENNQITIQYTKIMDMINLVLFIQNGDFYERTGVDNPEEYHQYSEFLIQLKENFPSNLDPNTIIDEISDDLIILSAK